jgi:hypothetical protein
MLSVTAMSRRSIGPARSGIAGCLGPPAHHPPRIDAVEPLAIELRHATTVGAILDGLEQRVGQARDQFTTEPWVGPRGSTALQVLGSGDGF